MSGRRQRWLLLAVLGGLPLLLAVPLLVIAYGAWTAPSSGGERAQDLAGLVAVLGVLALFYVLVARSRGRNS